jgi:hypothetical protein
MLSRLLQSTPKQVRVQGSQTRPMQGRERGSRSFCRFERADHSYLLMTLALVLVALVLVLVELASAKAHDRQYWLKAAYRLCPSQDPSTSFLESGTMLVVDPWGEKRTSQSWVGDGGGLFASIYLLLSELC